MMAYMTEEPPYLVRLGEAQTAVVEALFGFLPDRGWERCVVEYRALSSAAETQARLVSADGTEALIPTAKCFRFGLKRLRDLMAGQGRGAWLSVTVTATPDGTCSFDYNYDNRPNWTVQPAGESYVADLEKYPRPVELVPDWYPRSS